MRCGACGCKDLDLENACGKGFPYKEYEKVILTVDLMLPTCCNCGNILLKADDCQRLDEAIIKSLNVGD